MQPLSLVEFGPVDAYSFDKNFLEKYVEQNNFKILIDNTYSIITGEKGAGKSALIKGLTLKHKNEFTHIVNLSFNDLSFSPIIDSLTAISRTSEISSLYLIINYWKYSLIIEGMKAVIGSKMTHFSPTETVIYNYLVENKHIKENLFSRLLNLCLRIWQLIERLTRKPLSDDFPGILPPDILTEIKDFPLHKRQYMEAEKMFGRYIKKRNLRVLISLDGLDILRVNTREDFNRVLLIFEGLIAATYGISTSPAFCENIILKSLIPYDLYLGLNLRDMDKYEEKYRKMYWDYKSLQEFLRKRIVRCIDFRRSVGFEKAWSEILPTKVTNTRVEIEEDSFEYFLRHTLYRPRQLQVHLKMLAEVYEGRIIDEGMVSEVIRESTKKLVRFLTLEHKMTHPKFDEFIHHFRNKPNILTYGALYKLVTGILDTMGIRNMPAEEKISALYRIGFIGHKRNIDIQTRQSGVLYRYRPPVKGGVQPYICDFHHNAPNMNFTRGLRDEDEIVIHPLFYDYCNIKPTNDFVIG